MASITKRVNKAGDVSYLIRVFVEQGPGGKQTTKSMTWKPPAGMRPSAANKQAEKEAVLFEEKVRSGVVSIDGKTRFADYAAQWMDAAELAPKTREQYDYLLRRINQAIGHVPLEKLRVEHLQKFYKNLRERGVKGGNQYATSTNLLEKRKSLGISCEKMSEICGVSRDTIAVACKGEHISVVSAQKISKELGYEISELFIIEQQSDTLSDRTVWHHHKLIRAILASAKKSRVIPHNIASEFMEAPKLPRDEAMYLSDEEAQRFLAALLDEPDIRIKTALTLDLFTGLRRGELCGLSWPDIDFNCNIIHVRRASQYVAGQGIIEVPTKNRSSERNINVTPFVTEMLRQYKVWWIENRFKHGDKWKGDKERLFIQEDGRPIYPGTINGWLRKFNEKNDLPQITPHSLRHTFITLQIAAGVDIRTIQSRSGHAQASTLLNVYSHAIQSAQERAAQAMDDILLGNEEDKKTEGRSNP